MAFYSISFCFHLAEAKVEYFWSTFTNNLGIAYHNYLLPNIYLRNCLKVSDLNALDFFSNTMENKQVRTVT